MSLLLLAVYLVTLPAPGLLIPPLLFYLNRRKLSCLGYACSAKKPNDDAERCEGGCESP